MKYKCIKSYPWFKQWDISDSYMESGLPCKNYPEYWQPIEEEKDYGDYSKFIHKCWPDSSYSIKWQKWILFYDDWVCYNNWLYEKPSFPIQTTTYLISELNVWDVVYIEDWEMGTMKQEDFMVYVGKSDIWDYMFQYLIYTSWIEVIIDNLEYEDKQVIKFI